MTKWRNNDPYHWRPIVPAELREHVRHFLEHLPHDLRGSMKGFTVRLSDDVRSLARRLEQLAEELERKHRVTRALIESLTRFTQDDDLSE